MQPFLTWECLWVECRWSERWELAGETSEFSSLCWCRYYWGEERLSSLPSYPPPPAPPQFSDCQCSWTWERINNWELRAVEMEINIGKWAAPWQCIGSGSQDTAITFWDKTRPSPEDSNPPYPYLVEVTVFSSALSCWRLRSLMPRPVRRLWSDWRPNQTLTMRPRQTRTGARNKRRKSSRM